jgi:ATPase subunit of ABC transporter with duplicated ATPase domains
MSLLEARDLAVEAGGTTILEGLSLSLRSADKVGVVGRNGAGKTSLLQVLAGEAAPLGGNVRRRGSVGYLRQDPRQHVPREVTALAHLLQARGLHEMEERLERLRRSLEDAPTDAAVSRFARLEERYRTAGGYSGDAEARRVAAGLGLDHDRLDLPVGALSGGERRRLELARILLAGSEVLLLDEPTNHLDTDAKGWLMSFLAAYRGAVVVVSHDIALLDAAITRVLHLDRHGIVAYRGTYSEYREARRLDQLRLAAMAEREQAEIRRLRTLADSMRGQTEKRARKARTLDTRVRHLQARAVSAPARERRISYRFPEPPHCGRLVLEASGVTKGYGGPPIFQNLSFELSRGDRLLVMGLNGAGKTSLLRIVAGVAPADAGSVRLGTGVSLGYYAQEHEGIRDGVDVLSHVRGESTESSDQELRALLGMFGLTGSMAFRDAGTLSGGEKTKLALAQLVAGLRNVILLDEPTNNLDPPSRTAIGQTLARWSGSIVLVSHDAEFVEVLAPQRVLMMPEGTLGYWSDDLLELVALA